MVLKLFVRDIYLKTFTRITKTRTHQRIFIYFSQCYFRCLVLFSAIITEIIHIKHRELLLASHMHHTCFKNMIFYKFLFLLFTVVSASKKNNVRAMFWSFLGTFAKLRKATIFIVMSACLSVCPSVHMEQLGSHWTDFHEIWYLSIFQNCFEKNSRFIKIWQERRVLYMKTYAHFR